MEIILIRKHFGEKYTIGKLYIDQKYTCDTLEDKVRDLKDITHDGDFDDEGEGKVYGKTAIPCGRYKLIVNFSNKIRDRVTGLKKRLPLLLSVPGFKGIRIHGGRNETNTEGCILVGENRIKGQLVNYGYWETRIVQLIDEAKERAYITIKE